MSAVNWRFRLAQVLRRIAQWLDPPSCEQVRIIQAFDNQFNSQVPKAPSRQTNRARRQPSHTPQSGTWGEIEDALRVHGELSRKEIDALLHVTTAAQCLPLMVEQGTVTIIPGVRPYRYRLTEELT